MINVVGPEGQKMQFPDDATQDEINSAVQGAFGSAPAPPQVQTPSIASPEAVEAGGVSLAQAVAQEGPQVAGGVAGGVAAMTVGATGLAPLAGAVGLGAGAGEASRQLGQHLSGSLDAPKTSIEAAKRIGVAALTEGGFELVGGLVAKGFGKILAPFKSSMIPGLDDAAAQFKDKIQPVLLPHEATENRILDI